MFSNGVAVRTLFFIWRIPKTFWFWGPIRGDGVVSWGFDSLRYRYPSSRKVIFGSRGMVCASQPLAAQAGLDVMKKGGNAVDAAIATAACLTVLEPTGNGLGSDAFAIVCSSDGKIHGLNASGPAPRALDVESLRSRYGGSMPKYGWDAVTVPGAVAAWAEMSKKFGRLGFAELLGPAIEYATEGYPVSPVVSRGWGLSYSTFSNEFKHESLKNWFPTFAPEGRAPRAGEVVRLPEHASTLRELADTRGESFYRGSLAERIVAFAKSTGGNLCLEDLAEYSPEWVEPITVGYKGYTVHELPPNGHGIVALMALKILEGMEIGGFGEVDTLHNQIEAMKLAFTDGRRYVADPAHMQVRVEELLSDNYAKRRRALIGHTAMMPQPGDPSSGGTVYLCTADGDGNMVSFIQSNYMGFGSGVVVPGTGIALQNRGNNFSLDPSSENCAAPGKRPYHTIIPGFLSKGGKPIGPFGVMGGFMQPQGHLQVLMNTIDFNMNPQEALDAPRWQWTEGKSVEIERGFGGSVTEELVRRGHNILLPAEQTSMGRGQIIWRKEGVLVGGTEPRTDGTVAAY